MISPRIIICPYSKKAGTGRDQARYVLAREFSRSLDMIAIDARPDGKPFLRWEDVHIGITHSGALLALYIGPSEAGIDVERVKPRANVAEIAELVFSEREKREYAHGDGESLVRFYRTWTTMEATLKRQGLGLSGLARRTECDSAEIRHWQIGPGYILCVSAEQTVLEDIEIRVLPETAIDPKDVTDLKGACVASCQTSSKMLR